MRPKKRVLLYCPEETKLLEMTFLLETWGCKVWACDSLETAVCEMDCALVVADRHIEYRDFVVRYVKHTNHDLRVMLLLTRPEPVQTWADAVVYEGMGNTVLRETLKTACARKRGPRKKAA